MKTRQKSALSTWITALIVMVVTIGLWATGAIPVVAAIIVVGAAIGSSVIYTRGLKS